MTAIYSPLDLPTVKSWKKEEDFSLWDFLALEAGAEVAVAFSGLFWPEFVEVDGCVILQERYDAEVYAKWVEKLEGRKSRIEEVMNHVHLWDLFYADTGEVPDQALERLAEVLVQTWRCALREKFPDREFNIGLVANESDYGPTLYISSVCGSSERSP